ncbi:hypothetical protein [Nocardia tengchongensis]|uniref:hypothetical protein n=1 Tax=Nocardia tengchongensis TaxID=2055889 RepID=UPI00368DA6C5
MAKPPPTTPPIARGAFNTRTAGADAMRSAAAAPPAAPAPSPRPSPLHSVPATNPDTPEEVTPAIEYARPDDRGEDTPGQQGRSASAPDQTPAELASAIDPLTQVNRLIDEAVRATREQDREAIPEIVSRIATLTNRSDLALGTLLEAVLEVPATGKDQMPLEIAPTVHQKLKSEANRHSRPGSPSTMTTLVLQAIGAAHENGKLAELVEAHKAGERHKVPLFGNLKVGKAPRGETKRMQFQPPTTARIMIDILATWYRVDFVVLVRLALDAQFKRAKKSTDSTDRAQSAD